MYSKYKFFCRVPMSPEINLPVSSHASNLFIEFYIFAETLSLSSCKALAKSLAPSPPPQQPLLFVGFKGGQISQRACSSLSLLCWVPSWTSLHLPALAVLGVPPSPHTLPNLHSVPCSRLSSSDPISVCQLLISLPKVMMVASYTHARSLIWPTQTPLFAARFLKRHFRSCVLQALPMVS